MPQALPCDWDVIRELYLKGLPLREISEKVGVQQSTISSKATRAGWKQAAQRASALVQVSVNEAKEETQLSKQSERARSGLAATLERFVAKIETMEPKTVKAALKASGELESVVRNCKTVFGWSESQSQPAVRINILGSATIATDGPAEKPAIDLPIVLDTPKIT